MKNFCGFTQRVLQHNTQQKATPLRPWQDSRDGPKRLRQTSFKLHSPLVLEAPTKHPQDLPWEAEVRRPCPHRMETDSLEGLRQVQHQSHCSPIFFTCPISKSLPIQQDFPVRLLSSSISAINSFPINTALQLPLRHLKCSQSFSPTYNVGISAIGLWLVTFFGLRKNIVVQACCGHIPLCSTSPATQPPLHLFLLSNPGKLLGGSHRNLSQFFANKQIRCFSPTRNLCALAMLPPCHRSVGSPRRLPHGFSSLVLTEVSRRRRRGSVTTGNSLQYWCVRDWRPQKKDKAKLSSLFPHAHIESTENPSFRRWPSRFRKVARPPCDLLNYTQNKKAHKQNEGKRSSRRRHKKYKTVSSQRPGFTLNEKN